MKKLALSVLSITLAFSVAAQVEEYKLFTLNDGSRVNYIPWDNGQKYCMEEQAEEDGKVFAKNGGLYNCTPNPKYISEEYICKKEECDFVFDSKHDVYALYPNGKKVLILTAKSEYREKMPWVDAQIKEKRERIIEPSIEVKNIQIEKNENDFQITIPAQEEAKTRQCDKTEEFCFNNVGQLVFMGNHHVKNTPEADGEIKTAFIGCKNNGEFFIKTDNGSVFSMKIPRDGCPKRESLLGTLGLK